MTTHLINANKLYILSGPSASGKSWFTKQLIEQGYPEDAIISTDTIRKNILGFGMAQDDNGPYQTLYGWDLNNHEIFDIITKIFSIRLKQRLPIVFDATSLNDKERLPYIKLAKQYGMDSSVVIFDVPEEELQRRLSKRTERFDFSVVQNQLSKFEKISKYPFIIAKPEDKFVLCPDLIDTSLLDVVGDTHGLLDETIACLKQKGWTYHNNSFQHANPERKLLFVGDVLDRGPQSLPLLKAVANTVNNKRGYFIVGNHESKLIGSYQKYINEKVVQGRSISSTQTLIDFLRLPEDEREKLYQFLLNSPTHLSLWINKKNGKAVYDIDSITQSDDIQKFAFVHANNEYFHAYKMPYSYALYGKYRMDDSKDTDELYEKNFKSGINDHIFIRGHIPQITKQDHIYSLEDSQAFKGNLMVLDMDKLIKQLANNQWNMSYDTFVNNTLKYKTDFHFDDYISQKLHLLRHLDGLEKEGLIIEQSKNGIEKSYSDGFKIYSRSKKAAHTNCVITPLLDTVNGLVIDGAGNIIVHPLNKPIYSKQIENIDNLSKHEIVKAVKHADGFTGYITRHPFRNELLCTTTDSLNNEDTKLMYELISGEMKGKLLKYFHTNHTTITVDVAKSSGLCILGVKENEIDAVPISDTEINHIANITGLSQVLVEKTTVAATYKQSHHTSFSLYNIHNNEMIAEIKSTISLANTFITTLEQKNPAMLFKAPDKFKEDIDGELYHVVNKLCTTYDIKTFTMLSHSEKTNIIVGILSEEKLNIHNKNSKFKM